MLEDKNQERTALEELGEFGLIDHLTENFSISRASTLKGIGDDAAVLDFKDKKTILTTDCMAAAGAPSGKYQLGTLTIEVGEDRVVRQPGQTNFAGSSLTLDEGVVNFSRWTGVSENEAWMLASQAVADVFQIELPLIDVSQSLIHT